MRKESIEEKRPLYALGGRWVGSVHACSEGFEYSGDKSAHVALAGVILFSTVPLEPHISSVFFLDHKEPVELFRHQILPWVIDNELLETRFPAIAGRYVDFRQQTVSLALIP
jgi:hypothetical protein